MRIVGFGTGKRENISFGINSSLREHDVIAWTVTYKSPRACFIGYLSATPSTSWRTFSQGAIRHSSTMKACFILLVLTLLATASFAQMPNMMLPMMMGGGSDSALMPLMMMMMMGGGGGGGSGSGGMMNMMLPMMAMGGGSDMSTRMMLMMMMNGMGGGMGGGMGSPMGGAMGGGMM